MKLKYKVIVAYVVIGALYAIYEHFLSDQAGLLPWGKNIGHALVWPAVLVPGMGSIVGGLLIVAFVLAVTLT